MGVPINVNMHYPYSDKYEYLTILEILNLDNERKKDISNGNGFIISAPRPIKDAIKDENGIYSSKYGQTLQDQSPFADRYRCKCGNPAMQGRLYNGQICPICKTPVTYVGDRFEYFGWAILKDPYHIIHPNLYMNIASLIGGRVFDDIISPNMNRDEDGNEIEPPRTKDEPFKNIGMIEFYVRFDEIIDYYFNKHPDKIDHYNLIKENRDKVFTQSLPVFTTHLRPYKLEGGEMHYEKTNDIYNIMVSLISRINDDKYKINRKNKPKMQLLYNLQKKYMELDTEINAILSSKKGIIRTLYGGRFNYTARCVIAPDRELRSDQIKLSYHCLAGLLQQVIINILRKSYNMPYNTAYKYLYEHMSKPDDRIVTILEGLIKENNGIPVLINRNPTISIGSIIKMNVIGIEYNYTMSMPNNVLKGLEADFDGDTLNILYIINKDFERAASLCFSPRNSLYISKNDGFFNNLYNQQRDTVINLNTFVHLGRDRYSKAQLEKIKAAQESD